MNRHFISCMPLPLALLLAHAAPAATAAQPTATVVMLGDSTTLCSGSKPGTKLTDYVQAYLNQTRHLQATVVNSGIGGDTVKGGFGRLQKDVLVHRPDVVTISFGLNDTGHLTPAEFREWLEKLVQTIRQQSAAKIILVTSTPFNNAAHAWGLKFRDKGGLDEYMDAQIFAATRDLAKKYSLPLCDQHQKFLDRFKADPKLIDVLLMPDGVHLTEAGNQAAAENLAPLIADLLSPLPAVRNNK